jgi:hypothetical protein
MLSTWNYEEISYRMLKKAVQQGRSERRTEEYPLGYVEGLSDARTKLADFFSFLLGNIVEKSRLDRWQRRGLARWTGKDER